VVSLVCLVYLVCLVSGPETQPDEPDKPNKPDRRSSIVHHLAFKISLPPLKGGVIYLRETSILRFMSTPEDQAREHIDQALEQAGWRVQDYKSANL
jgi:hypothetical protein